MCYSVTSIPLRTCKEIAIHKDQTMSIGLGEPFESMIISLSRFRTSCIFSCYWYFSIVICDTNRPISLETLKNIGTGSSYNKRIKFDKLLKSKDTLSRGIVTDNSTKLHIVK